MKTFFNFLMAFVSFTFLTTAAHAVEEFNLAKYDDWQVSVNHYPDVDELDCSIETFSGDHILVIAADKYGSFEIFGLLEGKSAEKTIGKLYIDIDDYEWTFHDTSFENKNQGIHWYFPIPNEDTGVLLFEDMLESDYFIVPTRTADIKFSLAGFKKSMRGLLTCQETLQ